MKLKALMYAFMDGEEREIEVPEAEWAAAESLGAMLDLAYLYGQNDFQPREGRCSVSVGDILDMGPGKGLHLVKLLGFRLVSPQMVEEWAKVPRRDRSFHEWVGG